MTITPSRDVLRKLKKQTSEAIGGQHGANRLNAFRPATEPSFFSQPSFPLGSPRWQKRIARHQPTILPRLSSRLPLGCCRGIYIMANTEKRIRLSLDVPERVRTRIEELAETSGATSGAEVIRRALSLYSLALEHTAEGGRLVLRIRN